MSKYSRTEYSFRNMFASMAGYALNVILSFVCRIFFARILGAEYLGISGMFQNVLSLLTLTELGIGTAMTYALYKPVADDDKDKIASYMKTYEMAYRVVGIVVFILGLAIMPFLNLVVTEQPNIPENMYVLYLLFLFSTASSYFFSYRSSILIANQRNYIVVSISYAVVIVQDIVQIIILYLTKSYLLYLLLQIIFVLITNILISKKAVHDYPYINKKGASPLTKEEKRSLLKNVKALTVTKLSGILVNNTDNLVITYFNGLIQTGIVSNYSLLINTLNSLVNQLFTSLSGSLGNLNAVSDKQHKYEVFNSLNLANFWIYGWASIGIVVVSSDIIEIFFGSNYVMSIEIPIILAINFYMLGMQCVVGIYKSTMGLFRYGQYAMFLTAVLNLIGDFILGAKYGIFGIFLATALARLFTNTWYEPYVIFKYGFKRKFSEYVIRYIIYLLILLLTGGICFKICSYIAMGGWLQLFLKLLVCILVPNLIFLVVFFQRSEFQFIKNRVLDLGRKLYLHICKK